MNIACSVDEKFIKPLKVLLFSLEESQREEINLYLLHYKLPKKELKEIESFTKALTINLNLVEFPENLFKKIYETKGKDIKNSLFSIEVYFKLFLHVLLPTEIERVLWLDADTVVRKNILDFYYTPFNENYLIATPDIVNTLVNYKEIMRKKKDILGIPQEDFYFNAGVLLINLNKFRNDESFLPENILKLIPEKRFELSDQDILNFLLVKKVDILNIWDYNTPVKYISEEKLKKVAILHYLGPEKPWILEKNNIEYGKVQYYLKREKIVNIIDRLIKDN